MRLPAQPLAPSIAAPGDALRPRQLCSPGARHASPRRMPPAALGLKVPWKPKLGVLKIPDDLAVLALAKNAAAPEVAQEAD